jgi:hypothetical protein
MNELWIFLPAIIIAGIATSYSDMKTFKIRNYWIVGCLVYAISARLLLHFFGDAHLFEFLMVFLFSSVIGIGFWLKGYWAAVDAKMFISLCALAPLGALGDSYIMYPLFFLAASFSLAFAFTMIDFVRRLRRRDFKGLLRESFRYKELLRSGVLYLYIQWILSALAVSAPYLLSVVIMMLLPTDRLRKLLPLWVAVCLILLRFLIDRNALTLSFLLSLVFMLIGYRLFRSCLKTLQRRVFAKETDPASLQPGMVLGEGLKQKGELIELHYDCLTAGDIRKIRRLAAKGKIDGKALVQEYTFFAPYLAAGAILALLYQTGVFSFS